MKLIDVLTRIPFACTVCFGDPESSAVRGFNNGIFVMLGFVVVLMTLFGYFFWQCRRRSRLMRTGS